MFNELCPRYTAVECVGRLLLHCLPPVKFYGIPFRGSRIGGCLQTDRQAGFNPAVGDRIYTCQLI
jgi:hypothetical protein